MKQGLVIRVLMLIAVFRRPSTLTSLTLPKGEGDPSLVQLSLGEFGWSLVLHEVASFGKITLGGS